MSVSGYVFTSNVSSGQLENLFKPEKREKPDSEVLRSTIESWKEYNYNKRENKLVLIEPQEKTRQSEFVNWSLNVG